MKRGQIPGCAALLVVALTLAYSSPALSQTETSGTGSTDPYGSTGTGMDTAGTGATTPTTGTMPPGDVSTTTTPYGADATTGNDRRSDSSNLGWLGLLGLAGLFGLRGRRHVHTGEEVRTRDRRTTAPA